MNRAELIIYIITTILAFIGFFAGITTDFFGFLSKPEYVPIGACYIGILTLLIGDRIANGIALSSSRKEQQEKLKKTMLNIPQLNIITEFSDCDSAMEYLSSKMAYAHTVWNTKISGDGIKPRDGVASKFEGSLKKAIRLGVIYKDVVSESFGDYAENLKMYSEGKAGSYEFKIMKDCPNSFINFVLIKDKNGDEELIFGWATSKNRGNEQSAYKIRDQRVTSFFKDYHGDLFK